MDYSFLFFQQLLVLGKRFKQNVIPFPGKNEMSKDSKKPVNPGFQRAED